MPKSVISKINATRFERPLAVVLAGSAMFMVMAVPPASLSAVPALAASTALHAMAALIVGVLLGAAGYAAMAYPWPRRPVGHAAAPEMPEEEHGQFAAAEVSLRLRRADRHPDAPARAPIFASRDLGSPFMEVGAFAPPPGEPEAGQAIPEGDYAEVEPVAADPVTPAGDAVGPAAAPEIAADPVEADPVETETVAADPLADGPVSAEIDDAEPEAVADAPAHRAEPEWPIADMPAPIAAFAPEDAPAPAPARSQRQSIAEMMDRLSVGLERRAANGEGMVRSQASAPALREALEELNRLAARRG